MTQNETNISIKNIVGATTGGVIGYALAKKQNKTSFKSILIYTSIGSILGFLVAKNFFKKSGIIVQQ
jgi:presenilin-like A22 family membrane protease